ncbi:MAG: DUF2157 domain-containing protein [Cytophagales bacterium]|jgi:hypothetical protein|nr:DUF2157 domain-containing protein [Cytophagales bacterium]
MQKIFLREWQRRGLISDEQQAAIEQDENNRPFSLHWELKTLLYLGVTLLNAGLGWLIYENIDDIGHGVVIALIAAICIGCFVYVYRHRQPFSRQLTESPSPYFDYVLLLGCLMFVILEGYLQFQYNIFGSRYGLATFVPMAFFFTNAYRFDHKGVLSLGITALASWLGIASTPRDVFNSLSFHDSSLAWTGALLGVVLCGAAFLSEQRDFKKHFAFTYLNFGIHILFIACLGGIMGLENPLFSPLAVAAVAFFIWYARKQASLYFMIVALIYGYILLTYWFFQIEGLLNSDSAGFLVMTYFMCSCAGVIYFLLKYKEILGIKDKKKDQTDQ